MVKKRISYLEKSIIDCIRGSDKTLNLWGISKETGMDNRVVSEMVKRLKKGELETMFTELKMDLKEDHKELKQGHEEILSDLPEEAD